MGEAHGVEGAEVWTLSCLWEHLFSFHYESNLPTILPNNFGITAYLLCVASAHRLNFGVLAEVGNNRPIAKLNSP